jgi:hypothetical protein
LIMIFLLPLSVLPGILSAGMGDTGLWARRPSSNRSSHLDDAAEKLWLSP